jgi:hypothetical protein
MSQENIDPIVNNSDVCEAVGCFAKATLMIEVKVGERGFIPLSLCSRCVSKFEDADTECQQLEETRSFQKADREQKKKGLVDPFTEVCV